MNAFYTTKTGKKLFSIGKNKDKSINFVLKTDPKYIIWLKKNTKYNLPIEIEREIKRLKLL